MHTCICKTVIQTYANAYARHTYIHTDRQTYRHTSICRTYRHKIHTCIRKTDIRVYRAAVVVKVDRGVERIAVHGDLVWMKKEK